ncbi:MAG: hypothetical protein EF812_04545, partial [Methanosarcinales archaeon]
MKPLKNILIGIGILVTITIIAMAAAPELSDGNVTPSTGNTTIFFDFSVIFTDADNNTAEYVNVTIDGIDYDLSETDSDDNTTDGKSYSITGLDFISGTHIYNFTAADENDTADLLEGGNFTVTEAVVTPNLTYSSPSSPYSSSFGSSEIFSVEFDQNVTVVWKINDALVVQTNTSVAPSTPVYYTNDSAPVGVHTLTANGSNANSSAVAEWAWTVTDSTPPESITNLNSTTGMTWINWTWDNPGDADFDHVEVWLDDVNTTITQYEFYNA